MLSGHYLFIYLCVGSYVLWYTCRDQRTTLSVIFLPSTLLFSMPGQLGSKLSGILLSLQQELGDYRHTLLYLAFCGFWGFELKALCLHSNSFAHCVIFRSLEERFVLVWRNVLALCQETREGHYLSSPSGSFCTLKLLLASGGIALFCCSCCCCAFSLLMCMRVIVLCTYLAERGQIFFNPQCPHGGKSPKMCRPQSLNMRTVLPVVHSSSDGGNTACQE